MVESVIEIPVDHIVPCTHTLRYAMPLERLETMAQVGDPHARRELAALDAMAASLANPAIGQLHPIRVFPHPTQAGCFQTITGGRRLEAARRAGLATIQALVVSQPGAALIAQQIVENMQREDYADIELAWALEELRQLRREQLGRPIAWNEIEQELSLGHRQRQRLTALLRLPPEAQRVAAWTNLTERVLRLVVCIEVRRRFSPEELIALVRLIGEGVRVRDADGGEETRPYTVAEVQRLIAQYDQSPGTTARMLKRIARQCGKLTEEIVDVAQQGVLVAASQDTIEAFDTTLKALEDAVRAARRQMSASLSPVAALSKER